MKPYKIIFEIAGLPKTPNQLLGAHWTIRSGHAKKWKRAVVNAVMLNGGLPAEPLQKARVQCVRVSSGKMDADGLAGSFKACMDGLVEAGVLVDDSPDIVSVSYVQESGKRGHGKVRLTVEAA